MKISKFASTTNSSNPSGETTLEEFLKMVKDSVLEKSVSFYRSMPEITDVDKRKKKDFKLKHFESFTISGTFENGRTNERIQNYNGIVPVDIDKVEDPEEVRDILSKCQYVEAAFITVSGKGVCALVQTDNIDPLKHGIACKQVWEMIKTNCELAPEIDKACKDVCRLRIPSSDPDIYINDNTHFFRIDTTKKEETQKGKSTTKLTKIQKLIEVCKKEVRSDLVEGNRNNWIYQFACRCKEVGIIEKCVTEESLAMCPELSNTEIITTVKSVFQNEKIEFESKWIQNGKIHTKEVNEDDIMYQIICDLYQLRRNTVKEYVEYFNEDKQKWKEVSDPLMKGLYLDVQRRFGESPPSKERIYDYIDSVKIPQVNPIVEYYESLPAWDGKDHLADMANRVPTDTLNYVKYFKKFMVGMFAQSVSNLDTEETNHLLLILSGEIQGQYKTTYLQKILPPELHGYRATKTLDPESKDDQFLLCEQLLIIWDEMSQMGKREVMSLKAFTTLKDVTGRRAYGRFNVNMNRLASICGSTNQKTFLNDPTGSRRFVCVNVTGAIDTKTPYNYPQIYAQIKHLFESGWQYWLLDTENRELCNQNLAFQETDPLRDACIKLFRVCPNKTRYLTTADCMYKLEIAFKFGSRLNHKNLGVILNDLFGKYVPATINKKPVRVRYIYAVENVQDVEIDAAENVSFEDPELEKAYKRLSLS